MKYTYEINEQLGMDGNSSITIIRSDGAIIPTDPSNSDYQKYLEETSN